MTPKRPINFRLVPELEPTFMKGFCSINVSDVYIPPFLRAVNGRMLVFRDQRLTADQQIAFSSSLGRSGNLDRSDQKRSKTPPAQQRPGRYLEPRSLSE